MSRINFERTAVKAARNMRHDRLIAVYSRECGLVAILRCTRDAAPVWHDVKTSGQLCTGVRIDTPKRLHVPIAIVRKMAEEYNVYTKRVDGYTGRTSLYGLESSVPRFGDGWNTTYGKRRLNFAGSDVC